MLFDVFDFVFFGLMSLFAAMGVVTCGVMLKEGVANHEPMKNVGSLIGLAASVTWFILLGVTLIW